MLNDKGVKKGRFKMAFMKPGKHTVSERRCDCKRDAIISKNFRAIRFNVMLLFSVIGIILISGCINDEKQNESGLTVREKIEFSEDETAKLSSLMENIPEEVKQEFNTKYGAWKETWDDPNLTYVSNPKMFTKSRQYEEFLGFCKEQDKMIWPLLFQGYEQDDELVGLTIVNLTYTEYGSPLDEIRQESSTERYTAEGVYIAPSGNANMMKYIKKLLALI